MWAKVASVSLSRAIRYIILIWLERYSPLLAHKGSSSLNMLQYISLFSTCSRQIHALSIKSVYIRWWGLQFNTFAYYREKIINNTKRLAILGYVWLFLFVCNIIVFYDSLTRITESTVSTLKHLTAVCCTNFPLYKLLTLAPILFTV